MRWTRVTATTIADGSRTVKSCGPGAPMLAFKLSRSKLPGGDGDKQSPVTGESTK